MMSAMIIRAALTGVVALVVSASAAGAQGQPQKQVVISKPVMKSMIAHKAKSKAPLGAKVGMVKRKSVVQTKPDNLPPTSVKAIQPAPKKD